jgi:hypothetical protein
VSEHACKHTNRIVVYAWLAFGSFSKLLMSKFGYFRVQRSWVFSIIKKLLILIYLASAVEVNRNLTGGKKNIRKNEILTVFQLFVIFKYLHTADDDVMFIRNGAVCYWFCLCRRNCCRMSPENLQSSITWP